MGSPLKSLDFVGLKKGKRPFLHPSTHFNDAIRLTAQNIESAQMTLRTVLFCRSYPSTSSGRTEERIERSVYS